MQVHDGSTTSDKFVKAAGTLPFFDSGKVVIVNRPGRNGWVETYLNEFLSFPNGRFDDQVDSLVPAVATWSTSRTGWSG